MDCLKVAQEKGLTISFDGNFRSALWSWEDARDYCTQCLPYINVLFGIEPYHLWKDENDHSKGDWKDGVPLQPATSSRTRSSSVLSSGTPTSPALPGMCATPIPAVKTA